MTNGPEEIASERQDDKPPKRRWRRRLLRVAIGVAAAYVLWCGVFYVTQDNYIFPVAFIPDFAFEPVSELPGAQRIAVDLADGGQVEGWFVPAPSADADRPAPVVVYGHGNAELAERQASLVRGYHKLGCSVFVPEYRGYGSCGGEPSQEAIVSDTVRMCDLVFARADVDASRFVLHGYSLGGGVVAQVAAERKPAGLILESTFTNLGRVVRRFGVPGFLVRHPFRTDAVTPTLGVPTLIFHGRQDRLVPVGNGRDLAEMCPGSTYVEYDAPHNPFPNAADVSDYWAEIGRFLREAGIVE